MRVIRVLAIVLGVYLLLGLTADVLIGLFQPQNDGTVMIRTFDDNGAHETVLSLRDDDGQLWVESGHWFRGWYHRAVANPEVELIRNGSAERYVAVPVNNPETVEHMTHLMGKGQGAGYWIGRAMLLFAPIKPVRLDPADPGLTEAP